MRTDRKLGISRHTSSPVANVLNRSSLSGLAEMEKPRILIVDDEESLVFTLTEVLRDYDVSSFTKSTEAFEFLNAGNEFDIILMDFRMQGLNGIELLREAKRLLPSYKAVLITAYSSRELLEKGLNQNLFHRIVNKPFEPDELVGLVDEVFTLLRKERKDKEYFSLLQSRVTSLASSFGQPKTVLIHSCREMQEVLALVKKFATANANVLIEGESGVGKEIVAGLIHSLGPRADKSLIKLNCSTIPEHLFESELFGHKKGAFTGAVNDKPGKFQLADGGTLFLDEIGEMPASQQSKLLRAIEDFEITPLGATEPQRVDVRVISATNRNLEDMVDSNEFRNDLRFRLNILRIHIPPLRYRRQDIPLLTAYFLAQIANDEGRVTKQMEKDCLDYISTLDLPGNVRELKNLVYKAYLLTEENIITESDIKSIHGGAKMKRKAQSVFDRSLTLAELETEYIEYQLEKNNYCLADTARILGMESSNLSRKLKKMGISVREIKRNVG